MDKNGQEMALNVPKLPKIPLKWSELFRHIVQMRQGIPTTDPKQQKITTKNNNDDPKMTQKWPKINLK